VHPAQRQWSCGLSTEPKTLCSSPSSWIKVCESLVGLEGRFGTDTSPNAPTLLGSEGFEELVSVGEALLGERVV